MNNTEFITRPTKIKKYIKEINGHFSDKTSENIYAKFKKSMYLASFGHKNPVYTLKLRDSFNYNYSEDLYCVNELMYKFLEESGYLKIEYCFKDEAEFIANCNKDAFHNKGTKFKWKLPDSFLPYLTVYVLALYYLNKSSLSANGFFSAYEAWKKSTVDMLYDKDKEKSKNEKLSAKIDNFADDFLGKAYFCKLNGLYKKYSETNVQKEQLKQLLSPLTNTIMDASNEQKSQKLTTQICKQLDAYDIKLSPYHSSNANNLYDKKRLAFPIQFQRDFVTSYTGLLKEAISKTFNYINDNLRRHHIEDSIYPLSIDNYDTFSCVLCEYCSEIEAIGNKETTQSYFQEKINDILKDEQIDHFIKKGILEYDIVKSKTIMDYFIKHINEISLKLIKKIKKIEQFINYASSANPSGYDSLRMREDYVQELKDAIDNSNEELKKIDDQCSSPIFMMCTTSEIEKISINSSTANVDMKMT